MLNIVNFTSFITLAHVSNNHVEASCVQFSGSCVLDIYLGNVIALALKGVIFGFCFSLTLSNYIAQLLCEKHACDCEKGK